MVFAITGSEIRKKLHRDWIDAQTRKLRKQHWIGNQDAHEPDFIGIENPGPQQSGGDKTKDDPNVWVDASWEALFLYEAQCI